MIHIHKLTSIRHLLPFNIKCYFFAFESNFSIYYPILINIYLWNFGFLAGLCLIIQIISKVFIGICYIYYIGLTFDSLKYSIINISSELFFKFITLNCTILFFLIIYIYINQSHYKFHNKTKKIVLLKYRTLKIFFCMLVFTIFIYINFNLLLNQWCFWIFTVITGIFANIPIIGNFLIKTLYLIFLFLNCSFSILIDLYFYFSFFLVSGSLIFLSYNILKSFYYYLNNINILSFFFKFDLSQNHLIGILIIIILPSILFFDTFWYQEFVWLFCLLQFLILFSIVTESRIEIRDFIGIYFLTFFSKQFFYWGLYYFLCNFNYTTCFWSFWKRSKI